MRHSAQNRWKNTGSRLSGKSAGQRAAIVVVALTSLVMQGCFSPVYPQKDREDRAALALADFQNTEKLPDVLTPEHAVAYALRNNLDAKVAEIETAYQTESLVAAKRRLLPSLTLRYSMDHNNHPAARWSESTRSGTQSLESSYSADPNSRQAEVGAMWSLLDFGVGYLRSRQQGERVLHSREQRRRVRQQITLEVMSNYWRSSAALTIAAEAEELRRELSDQALAIQDSVEMRILSGAEGARRELAVHSGLAELEQWSRNAVQAKLELRRVLGAGNDGAFTLPPLSMEVPESAPGIGAEPVALQAAALRRRPELFQYDTQERIAVDEARLALLQMAPNANLSLGLYDDPDKFLEWSNWMTAGARVTWNLFSIPARLSERRMAKIQEDVAKQKGLALAAAVMAQVGIAYSDWGLSRRHAGALAVRAATRRRLVEALAAGEADGQTRPGEVLQERVRLLSEKAAALRAAAEARIAAARLANAVGLDVDDQGRIVWNDGDGGMPPELEKCENLAAGKDIVPARSGVGGRDADIAFGATPLPEATPEPLPEPLPEPTPVPLLIPAALSAPTPEPAPLVVPLLLGMADETAAGLVPGRRAGLRVIKAEEFLAPDHYFEPD